MPVRSRYPQRIEYRAESVWDGKTGGTAIASEGRSIIFDTPKSYGGRGTGICPDELFVCAVLGCLNNTFLDFQRRFEMGLVSIGLNGYSIAAFEDGAYRIQSVKVSGEIVVGEDELETGKRCLELMKEYCHLSRSIGPCIPVEFDIVVREATASGTK